MAYIWIIKILGPCKRYKKKSNLGILFSSSSSIHHKSCQEGRSLKITRRFDKSAPYPSTLGMATPASPSWQINIQSQGDCSFFLSTASFEWMNEWKGNCCKNMYFPVDQVTLNKVAMGKTYIFLKFFSKILWHHPPFLWHLKTLVTFADLYIISQTSLHQHTSPAIDKNALRNIRYLKKKSTTDLLMKSFKTSLKWRTLNLLWMWI